MTHRWLLSYRSNIYLKGGKPVDVGTWHGEFAGVRAFWSKYEGYVSRVVISGSTMPNRDSEGSGIANAFLVGSTCSVPQEFWLRSVTTYVDLSLNQRSEFDRIRHSTFEQVAEGDLWMSGSEHRDPPVPSDPFLHPSSSSYRHSQK